MKRYITMVAVILVVNCGIYVSVNAFQGDQTAYRINITTPGDDAIVNAIKEYSDITESDVNRWGFSWIPVVGSTIRDGMITKVREFLRVCRGLSLANTGFNNSNNLTALYATHNVVRVCRALKNLDEQGDIAQALLGRFANVAEKNMYGAELARFITNIKQNKAVMKQSCGQKKQKIVTKAAEQLQTQRNLLEYNKLWWQTQQLRWKMAKDMSAQAYKGVRWLAQTVNENSVPLFSAAAMLFVYDRMFGIRR
jgi:hypothetical protein